MLFYMPFLRPDAKVAVGRSKTFPDMISDVDFGTIYDLILDDFDNVFALFWGYV